MQAHVLHGVIVVTFTQSAGALLLHVEALLLHVEVQGVIFVALILLFQVAMSNVPA